MESIDRRTVAYSLSLACMCGASERERQLLLILKTDRSLDWETRPSAIQP